MDLLHRLRLLARRLNRDDLGFDVKEIPQLMQAIEEARAAKETELADLFDAEIELTDIGAAMDTTDAGGPGDDDANSNSEKE